MFGVTFYRCLTTLSDYRRMNTENKRHGVSFAKDRFGSDFDQQRSTKAAMNILAVEHCR